MKKAERDFAREKAIFTRKRTGEKFFTNFSPIFGLYKALLSSLGRLPVICCYLPSLDWLPAIYGEELKGAVPGFAQRISKVPADNPVDES